MSAHAFDLPTAFARMWVDSSLQMMRAGTELWTGLLEPAPGKRASSSTASPWWMPPRTPTLPATAGMWGPFMPRGMVLPAFSPDATNTFFPWLPKTQSASSNPFALWQDMWLPSGAPTPPLPWQPAQAPVVDEIWGPATVAYRTAGGHAMAVVLRTMANAIEPKPHGFTPASYWPMMLGSHH